MQREIYRVVAPDVHAAQGVIQRERDVGKRPFRHRRFPRRQGEELAKIPQVVDLRVDGEHSQVIEDERVGEGVGIRQGSRQDEQAKAPGQAGTPDDGAARLAADSEVSIPSASRRSITILAGVATCRHSVMSPSSSSRLARSRASGPEAPILASPRLREPSISPTAIPKIPVVPRTYPC